MQQFIPFLRPLILLRQKGVCIALCFSLRSKKVILSFKAQGCVFCSKKKITQVPQQQIAGNSLQKIREEQAEKSKDERHHVASFKPAVGKRDQMKNYKRKP